MDVDTAAALERLVCAALDEDLRGGADLTAEATVPSDLQGAADVVARAPGVVAGVAAVAEVYRQVDRAVLVQRHCADGDAVASGTVVASVAGPLRAILTGERTALNLLTHLSGVATATRAYVDAIAGTACVVRDTRKTTPGLRLLEKAAVAAGGGVNHRTGLYDGVLVKDNHVAAAGSVAAATRAALASGHAVTIQIEVDSMEELRSALDAGARDILLDNFTPEQTVEAVSYVRSRFDEFGHVPLESSGMIRLETVRAYAEAGVDRVSIGAITHSAPQLDLALDVRVDGGEG